MHIKKLISLFSIIIISTGLFSCEDTTTTIGSSITSGEVSITIDTLEYNLNAKPIRIDNFDSKTGNMMIGKIQVDNYGTLSCSFVTRLMCASSLEIPDSIFKLENFLDRVDSCKLIMGAQRADIVGDSLAPQVMTVYQLNRQLPSDINNTFNPEGYFDPSTPMASKSYTVSEISSKDSLFYKGSFVDISVDLPLDFGKEIMKKYKEEPEIFQWPQTMAEKFPLYGLYLKPTFGNGCVANIQSIYVGVFYHTLTNTTTVVDGDTIVKQTHASNLSVPFSVSPEVLSSNNITYNPSDNITRKNSNSSNGEVVITTPGGYIAEFDFPAQSLLDIYKEKDTHLSTVNELTLYIPAESFDTSSGIGVAQNLLLVKTSEYEDFFAENRIPDNLTSFTGVYDEKKGHYYFTSMRSYFLELFNKDKISQEDIAFTLVPVEISTETVTDYYGSGVTYVTKCVPYMSKPTMTLLKTNSATITFSFSTQMID